MLRLIHRGAPRPMAPWPIAPPAPADLAHASFGTKEITAIRKAIVAAIIRLTMVQHPRPPFDPFPIHLRRRGGGGGGSSGARTQMVPPWNSIVEPSVE